MSLAAVEAAVTELTKNEDDVREEAMQVVSAFKQPKYLFNPARKTYFLCVAGAERSCDEGVVREDAAR